MKRYQSMFKTVVGIFLVMLSCSSMAINFSTSRVTANTYSDGLARYLPIDNAGNTMRWVHFNSTAMRAVFYNAECSVKSSDTNTYYDINIQIISPAGAVSTLAPSSSDNAFCSGKGDNLLRKWSSNATNGTYKPSVAGWHRVRIRGQLMGFNPGERARIDDISLIITD